MCRMLIAVGTVNVSWLIDDFITMARDKNERHENNENKDFPHGDGWGISYIENEKLKVYKSPKPCYEDSEIHSFKQKDSPLFILHARRGSVGEVKWENVHPFNYSNYVFCHNGTIDEELKYEKKFIPRGETDSERLFYYLLSGQKNGLTEKSIFDKYIKINDFMGMNTIVTDGNISYIINWYEKKPKYYTYKILKEKDFVIISSEILPHFKNSSWQKTKNHDIVKLNTLTKEYEKYSFS